MKEFSYVIAAVAAVFGFIQLYRIGGDISSTDGRGMRFLKSNRIPILALYVVCLAADIFALVK